MKQSLVDYYQRELNYLKRRGEAFADEYPKIAARLQVNDDLARDPHVERIIQGVAFLNARIRKKIEDDFPQLCQSVLDVMYPHYLRPLPSYSIVSFEPEKDLTSRARVKQGSVIEADVDEHFACRFKTVYPTDVLPAKVDKAVLQSYPAQAPNPQQVTDLESVLRLRLSTINSDAVFEKIDFETLRFYIKGNRHYSFALYELIHNHTVTIAVAKNDHDPKAIFLNPEDVLFQVGFNEDEGILPYPEQSFIGYRLLTEYFAYPEKFLFFDLKISESVKLAIEGQQMELFFYFNKSVPDIEATVEAKNFVLNATPIINLYDQFSEPTRLTHKDYEYPLVADARNPDKVEIYSVEGVSITTDQDKIEVVTPFFGIADIPPSETTEARWHSRREEIEFGNTRSQSHLSLINIDPILKEQGEAVVLTQLRCFNGSLPKRLSQTHSQPKLILSSGASAVDRIRTEIPFTDVIRPRLDDDIYWQLLSHLNLNYISLTQGNQGTAALRKILSLYNVTRHQESSSVVDAVAITDVSPATLRIADDRGMPFFCRGSKVEITLDKTKFAGSSPFLFACVIERFLGLYTHINSFVQLSVVLGDKDHELKCWPARAGDQSLL